MSVVGPATVTPSSSVAVVVAGLPGDPTPPVVEGPVDLLGVVPGQGKELMDPFPQDGPLGQKGESLSLSQLCSRSRAALEEFDWNAISVGRANIYRLPWHHFVNFGCKIGINMNKLSFDYSLVSEFLVYRLYSSGSLSSVLSSHSAIFFYWKLGSDELCPSESKFV